MPCPKEARHRLLIAISSLAGLELDPSLAGSGLNGANIRFFSDDLTKGTTIGSRSFGAVRVGAFTQGGARSSLCPGLSTHRPLALA